MGDTRFSEYSKIRMPGEVQEKAWLQLDGTIIDVSANHWLLCIEPIVFGIWIGKSGFAPHKGFCRMYYGDIKTNPEAVLDLAFFNCIEEADGTLLLLKLADSHIYHLRFIRSWLIFFRYYRRDGLTFSRFKSFVSAYSYPRRIRLVSFRQDDYYTIFPMDLLGDIASCRRYVFGLRHSNAALPRIMATGKLLVCEVPYGYKDIIYQLGAYHTSRPPAPDSLPFDWLPSRHFQCYVPVWAESYKEINIIRTMNLGSHLLLWGELLEEQKLTGPVEHLFLVHFLHYLYKKNKGLPYQAV